MSDKLEQTALCDSQSQEATYPPCPQRPCTVRWSYTLSRFLEEGQDVRRYRAKAGGWVAMDVTSVIAQS